MAELSHFIEMPGLKQIKLIRGGKEYFGKAVFIK